MGKIAEKLRGNLRDLAQADARFLRELDDALPAAPAPKPGVAGALADGLEALSGRDLKTLCKERGYKGYTSLNKAALIQRLRGGEAPLASKTAAQSPTKQSAMSKAEPPGLASIEARLDRMEALLQRIAERVGVCDLGSD
jgi:hypothetical protein